MLAVPRTDPYVKNYLIRLLLKAMTVAMNPSHHAVHVLLLTAWSGSVSGAIAKRTQLLFRDPLPSIDSRPSQILSVPRLAPCDGSEWSENDSLQSRVSFELRRSGESEVRFGPNG